MTRAPAGTWYDPPPEPLDTWAAVRAQIPDTDDHAARHRRGVVRLPYEINPEPGERAGDLAEAWVCCDPACAGVELNQWDLDRNHGCCDRQMFVGQRSFVRGRHRVGLGRVHFHGYYHGPYTAYWEPGIAGGSHGR